MEPIENKYETELLYNTPYPVPYVILLIILDAYNDLLHEHGLGILESPFNFDPSDNDIQQEDITRARNEKIFTRSLVKSNDTLG